MQRDAANGGHDLQRCDKGWRCSTCKATSATWASLATQSCKGHATDRWAAVALNRKQPGDAADTRHKLVVSEPLTWCYVCAGYAESAPLLLTHPCKGKPRQDRRCARRRQLQALRDGKHPETRIRLLPPIPLRQWKEQQQPKVTVTNPRVHSASTPPPAIPDDGTEFTRAFLSRGRGASTVQGETAKDRILKRLASTQAGQSKAQRTGTADGHTDSTPNVAEGHMSSHPVIGPGSVRPPEEQNKRKQPATSSDGGHIGKGRQRVAPVTARSSAGHGSLIARNPLGLFEQSRAAGPSMTDQHDVGSKTGGTCVQQQLREHQRYAADCRRDRTQAGRHR